MNSVIIMIPGKYVFYVAVIIMLVLVLMHFSQSHTSIYRNYKYFDYNGTTPMHKQVAKLIHDSSWLGNPSGAYAKQAKAIVESANTAMAAWLRGVNESEAKFLDTYHVVWNSGASEGNNQILRNAIGTHDRAVGTHIVLSAVEHKTSIDCAKQLSEMGLVDVTFVEPSAQCTIDPIAVAKAIRPNTVVVSIMHTNNETGAVNNIRAITSAVRAASADFAHRVLVHVDVVQSIGKGPIPMTDWDIDAITMSFHKVYGPTGLGALVVRKSTPLRAQILGSQNNGLRGGTENIPAIAAVPITMSITTRDRSSKNARLREFKQFCVDELLRIPGAHRGDYSQYYGQSDDYDPFSNKTGTDFEIVFLGDSDSNSELSSPSTLYFAVVRHAPLAKHFCNIVFRDALLEHHRVIVSIGSACAASQATSSHVLTAMKAPYIIRCGVIRISFGDPTRMKDVRALMRAVSAEIRAQTMN